MTPAPRLHGLVAEFSSSRELLAAARAAYRAGYRRMDAYSPFPVEGLAHALGQRRNAVAFVCLVGGLAGGVGGYFLQDYAMSVSYPLNVGGRPLHSIPAFIPITFELTILCAALCTVIGMLLLNRLPCLHHPLFALEEFRRVTTDGFFLCIEAADPHFSPEGVDAFLRTQRPLHISQAG